MRLRGLRVRRAWYGGDLPKLTAESRLTALQVELAGGHDAYRALAEDAVKRAMDDLACQQEKTLEEFLASGAMLRDLSVEEARPTLTSEWLWGLVDAVNFVVDINWRIV